MSLPAPPNYPPTNPYTGAPTMSAPMPAGAAAMPNPYTGGMTAGHQAPNPYTGRGPVNNPYTGKRVAGPGGR
jgi:hypothetical protein